MITFDYGGGRGVWFWAGFKMGAWFVPAQPRTCTVAGESAGNSVSFHLPFIHSFSYTSPPHSRVAHSLPEKGRTISRRLVPCRKKELNRRLVPCRKKEPNRRLIPCRKKERSRRLLARIKGLCIQYPSGTAEAMPKFLADSFMHIGTS